MFHIFISIFVFSGDWFLISYILLVVDCFFPRFEGWVLCCAYSCPTLCDPRYCSPLVCSVHENSPGKNTGVGCHALLRGSFQTRDQTQVSRLAGRFFISGATREAQVFQHRWFQKLNTMKWLYWKTAPGIIVIYSYLKMEHGVSIIKSTRTWKLYLKIFIYQV